MKRILFPVLILLITASCNPLKRVRRTEKTDSTEVDKSEIRKMVVEAIKEETNFTQTVIEFYPPESPAVPDAPVEEERRQQFPAIAERLPEAPAIKPPPVRRIIRTEFSTKAETEKETDSIVHRDIVTGMVRELSDKVVEKPPSSVIALRLIVAGIACVLLIIIAIKLRFK